MDVCVLAFAVCTGVHDQEYDINEKSFVYGYFKDIQCMIV